MFLRYLINNLILISIFLWYNNHLFKRKKYDKWYSINCLCIVFLLIIKSFLNTMQYPETNLFLTVLVHFIISLLFFESSLTKRAVFIGFYICATFISEINVYLLLNSLIRSYAVNLNIWIYNTLGSILSAVLLFYMVKLITDINGIKEITDSKVIWYISILPITSLIILYSVIHFNLLNIKPFFVFLLTLVIIINNFILCIGFTDILKSKNILIENEQLKNQELYYKLLKEKYNNSRHFIHDFKKHINLIDEFIKKEDYNKLKEYISESYEEMKADENLIITGNQLIDLIVNTKKQDLEQHNICIKHDVQLKNIDPIKTIDFNIAFSNLLDNALESCIKDNGHFIKIKLDRINDLIVLKVINPCNNYNPSLKTTKSNKNYHGFGIHNIQRIAYKYNGYTKFSYDDEYNIFIATIIFNTQGE